MKRSTQIIIHLGLLLSVLTLGALFLFIGCSIKGSTQITLHIFPLASLICLLYLCNEWLSGKGLPANALVIINIIFCIIAAAAGFFCLQAEPATFAVRVYQSLLPAVLILYSFYFTWFPEKPQSLILSFDSLVAFFLIYLFLDMANILLPEDTLEVSYLIITGIVLFFVILIRISSDEEHSGMLPRGFFPIILLIAGCLLLALAFSLLISGQVKSVTDFFAMILKYLVLGIFWVLGKISDLLGIFFTWLINLLPDPEAGVMDTEIPTIAVPEAAAEETAITVSPIIVAAVLLTMILLVLFFLFRHLKGKRMLKKNVRKKSGHIQRTWQRPSVGTLLHRLYENLRFHVRLFRKRKTPAGLLYRIEQHGKKQGRARITGESAPAYLMRLSRLADFTENPDIKQALVSLADLVQREYYAGESQKVSAELYKQVTSSF